MLLLFMKCCRYIIFVVFLLAEYTCDVSRPLTHQTTNQSPKKLKVQTPRCTFLVDRIIGQVGHLVWLPSGYPAFYLYSRFTRWDIRMVLKLLIKGEHPTPPKFSPFFCFEFWYPAIETWTGYRANISVHL